jgi:hypothetical protein
LKQTPSAYPQSVQKIHGIEDAIRNNETGILVDPKNAIEVSQAIEKVLCDYEFSFRKCTNNGQCSTTGKY